MFGVLFAVLIVAAAVAAHLLCSHLVAFARRERVLVRFLVAAAAVYALGYPIGRVVVAPAGSLAVLTPAFDYLTGLAGAGFLILGYLELWSLIERSFSLRILIDAAGAAEGLAREEIEQSYAEGRGLGWMMDKRVSDLVGSSMLTPPPGPQRLTPRGRLVARVFGTLHRLFLVR